MNKKAYIILLLTVSGMIAFGEISEIKVWDTVNNMVSVPAGEKWKIISYASTYSIEVYQNTNRVNRLYYLEGTGGTAVRTSGFATGAVIVGPAVLFGNGGQFYLSFDKIEEPSLSQSISATSVVIPSSASGDVDIKLEQSADNVTWTECLPGTYNSSTVKRFFRLRAVEK